MKEPPLLDALMCSFTGFRTEVATLDGKIRELDKMPLSCYWQFDLDRRFARSLSADLERLSLMLEHGTGGEFFGGRVLLSRLDIGILYRLTYSFKLGKHTIS